MDVRGLQGQSRDYVAVGKIYGTKRSTAGTMYGNELIKDMVVGGEEELRRYKWKVG